MRRTEASIPHRLIITIGGVKGGSGRSTFAIHAAVEAATAGLRTVLIDAGEQECSTLFTKKRAKHQPAMPGYLCLSKTSLHVHNPRQFHSQMRQLTEKYDRVIIDIGGTETRFQMAALAAAHILVIPVEPTQFDAYAFNGTEQMVCKARRSNPMLVAYGVLNRAGSPGGMANERSMAGIIRGSTEVAYLNTPVRNHIAYQHASGVGLAVSEMKGSQRNAGAINDMQNLLRALQDPRAYAAEVRRLKRKEEAARTAIAG